MSKLLTEPRNGYVKPKDDASSGIYPKTLVDAVYNEEKGESLSETLKTLESQGGGGGISDDMTYEEKMEARKNLGLYYTGNFICYGEGEVVQVNSEVNALRFDIATVLNGKQSLIEDYDEIIAAIPTYEEMMAGGGIYDSGSLITYFKKESEKTTYLEGYYNYYITQGSDIVPSGFSYGDYSFSAPGIYIVQNYSEEDVTTPQLTWTKNIKISSEYLPETDLSNVKIPGYLYMTMPSELKNLTRVHISGVAGALQMTSSDLESLFGSTDHRPFIGLAVKSANGNPTSYISCYELYKDRFGNTDATLRPIITTNGTDKIFELSQPETTDYLHLKVTRHSSTFYSVLVDAPD